MSDTSVALAVETIISEYIKKQKPQYLVLAFDIEGIGQYKDNAIIEIGVCVVAPYPSLIKVDSYSYSEFRSEPAYKDYFIFEDRCKIDFWDKNKDILDAIEKNTNKAIDVEESRRRMIDGFVSIVEKWEALSNKYSIPLFRTTDNKVYDPAKLNLMIEQYLPGKPTFPYTFLTGKWASLPETHSIQLGILLAHFGKEFIYKSSGLTRAIENRFNVKYPEEIVISHDHRSVNDAYTIARELCVCFAIAEGTITYKEDKKKLFIKH
jgi:hypothetical protein